MTPDTLTVALFALPLPGYYSGISPSDPGQGVGPEMVNQMAKDYGLQHVKYELVNFDAMTSGLIKDFDFAYGPDPTPAREKVSEFSKCWGGDVTVIVARKGTPVSTLADLKKLHWGVALGSIQDTILSDEVKPSTSPHLFNGTTDMYPALLNGSINAIMDSLSEVGKYINNPEYKDKGFEVLTQVKAASSITESSCFAMLLPKGSTNLPAVNEALDKMESDGQMAAWTRKYLVASYGGVDPSKLPTVNVIN